MYYEVTIRRTVVDKKGNDRSVTEKYICENIELFAEAEQRVLEYFNAECDVTAIKRSPIREFANKPCDDAAIYIATITDTFVRDDGSGNNAFFKGVWNGETYTIEPIATIEKQNNDPQGFFNFGGGCLIGGGGSNSQNRILVRCIDAERARGWSGGGGDVCGTNNANFAWGN